MDAARRAVLVARLAQIDALIAGYYDAMLVFATNGGISSYDIDTGQSRQKVQRSEPADLLKVIQGLEAARALLESQLCGGNVVRVIPDW